MWTAKVWWWRLCKMTPEWKINDWIDTREILETYWGFGIEQNPWNGLMWSVGLKRGIPYSKGFKETQQSFMIVTKVQKKLWMILSSHRELPWVKTGDQWILKRGEKPCRLCVGAVVVLLEKMKCGEVVTGELLPEYWLPSGWRVDSPN